MCLLLFLIDLSKDNISSDLKGWLDTLISSFIKLILCINFALIFTYCAELFPTKIRGLSLGFCVLFGRLSTIFALGLE